MPGAIQLPVNQKNLPRSKKRKTVITKRINNGNDYKVRACVRRPGKPGLVALINYNFYDTYNNRKKYVFSNNSVNIDARNTILLSLDYTGAPSSIFPYHIKRTFQDRKAEWNPKPMESLGYGKGAWEICAYKKFEVHIGDDHNWSKWVQTKIAVWELEPGDEVEYALIGNGVTDQLAYVHEPRSPLKFLDSTDEGKLTQFLSGCN